MTNQDAYPLIAAACIAAGHTAEVVDNKLVVLGLNVSWWVEVKKQQPKDLYLSRRQAEANPKFYVTIGQIGDRSTHRQKSDGSFNWEAIAEKLVLLTQDRIRSDTRARTARTNEVVAEATRKTLGMNSYWGPMSVSASEYGTDLSLKVKIEITTSATPERAEEIYKGLVALGLISPKS